MAILNAMLRDGISLAEKRPAPGAMGLGAGRDPSSFGRRRSRHNAGPPGAGSGEVETVGVHHLGPRLDEILDEFSPLSDCA